MKPVYEIFFSPTHASATIADTIGAAIERDNRTIIDLTFPVETETVIENGIAVFAVPVYGGRVAESAVCRLKSVRGTNSEAIVVVLYGNRDYEDALLELRDIVVAQGFHPIAAAAFIGEHSYSRKGRPIAAGRPDIRDIESARDFGRTIAENLTKNRPIAAVTPKGNFPYKEKGTPTPQTPVTIEALCVQCEHCIAICPTESIKLETEIASDPATCIKCCACVKECPSEARVFDTPYTDLLFQKFSTRREPELFYPE